MIKATFYKTNYNNRNNANEKELFIGFNIKGHSGYAEAGSDIVCASRYIGCEDKAPVKDKYFIICPKKT